ncbi:MAG: hypothetical protein K2N94_05165 [Lachnospiraceae bacterium]|nr:hypothetical protein [Lachnospiraceae bacterium]
MLTEPTVHLEKSEYGKLIDFDEAARYLGYGEVRPTAEIWEELQECAERLKEALCPAWRYIAARLVREEVKEGVLPREELAADFGRERLALPGKSIREHLSGSELVLCAGLTLGAEVDERLELLQRESMLSALLFDALANAAVERLRVLLEERAAADFPDMRPNWLFGIGYGDLPLALQSDFLRLTEAKRELGLACSEKLILIPTKSVTGFLGLFPKEAPCIPDTAPLRETSQAEAGRKPCEDVPTRTAGKETGTVPSAGRTSACGKGSCAECQLRASCPFSEKG